MRYHKLLALYCLSFFGLQAQENIRAVTQFPLAATYHIDNSWQTGYQVTVTLKNNSANPTSSWMSTFTLGQGQSIGSLWNGVLKTNSPMVTVTNPAWIGGETIPAHGSTTFGFIVSNPQSTTPVLNNLQAVANAAGGNLNNIVKLTIFLTDLTHFPIVNNVMAQYFAEPYPARSTIEVAGLPKGVAIEIEAILVL